jgi:hypothetical protein
LAGDIERKKGIDTSGPARAVTAACTFFTLFSGDKPDCRISQNAGAGSASITVAAVLSEVRK